MQNLNKITKILGATFILVGSCNVLAETLNSTATTTVQNAFTLTETTALDFGTVRAVADPTGGINIAQLVLAPDGTSTTPAVVGNSALTLLTAGSAGVISVTGAAAFTNLTVTFPANFTLTATGAPPTSPTFEVLNADWVGTVVGGANDGATYAGANLQTDSAGVVGMNFGTTLKTDSVASTTAYIDAAYTGNYVLTVVY